MNKNILSEIALYYGDIAMPKNFEIDRDKLSKDILQSDITDSPFHSQETGIGLILI